jgi:DMSO/TMAO reductase YedYZ molybdopterin-dependent catalytic subunit
MPNDHDPLDSVRPKFVESKKQWAREGRLLTGTIAEPTQRLPPGQREVKNWPVLDLGLQPDLPTAQWKLTIDGMVENPLVWDWAAFNAQPQARRVSDIHCVTAWSRFDNTWDGVSTQHLLDIVRPKPQARFVVQHSYDGYTTNVPIEHFAAEATLLASRWEGKPISREHGGPVRLILPRLYLWKSAKWLQRLEFINRDITTWATRGSSSAIVRADGRLEIEHDEAADADERLPGAGGGCGGGADLPVAGERHRAAQGPRPEDEHERA